MCQSRFGDFLMLVYVVTGMTLSETKLVTRCSYERSLKKSRLEQGLTHSLHICAARYSMIWSLKPTVSYTVKIWLQFLCPNMNIVIKIMPQCFYCLKCPFHWDDLRHLKSCSPNSCYFYATTVYFHLIHSNTWSCLFVGRQEWLLKGSVHRTCQTHHLQLSSLKIFWTHDHWWVQPWLESGGESRFCGKFNSPILVCFVLSFERQGVWYFLLEVGNPPIAASIAYNYCEGELIWCHLVIRVRSWVLYFFVQRATVRICC